MKQLIWKILLVLHESVLAYVFLADCFQVLLPYLRNGKILPVLAPLLFFLILIIGIFYPLIINGSGPLTKGSDAITNLYDQESKNKIKPTTTDEVDLQPTSVLPLKAFRGSYDPFSKSKLNLYKNAYYQLSDSLNSDVYQKAFSSLTNSASNQAERFFNYINPLGLFIPDIISGNTGIQNTSLDPIQPKWFGNRGLGYYTYDYNYDKNSNNYFPTVVNSVDNSSYLIVPSQQINHTTPNYVYLLNDSGIFVEDPYDIPVSLEYHVKASDGSKFSKIFATTPPATDDDHYFSANFLFSRTLQTLTNALLVSDDIQNSLINYFASFNNDKKSISFTDFSSDASKAISDNKDNILNELNKLKTLKAPDDITNWLNEFFSPLIKQLENNWQDNITGSKLNHFNYIDYGDGLSEKQRLLSEISSISELINAITPSNFVLLISGYAALYFSIFTSYHNVASSITDLNSGTNQGLKLNLSYSADGTTQKAYDAKSLALPESLILGVYPKTELDMNHYWWANSDYGINFKTITPKLNSTTPSTSSKDPLFNLLGFLGNGANPPDTSAPDSYPKSLFGKSYMDALQDKNLWNTMPIEYAPNNELDKNFWTQDFINSTSHTGYDGYNRNSETPYTPFLFLPSSQVFILTEFNRAPTWAIALLWTLVSLALIPAICVVFLRRDYLEVNN